MKIYSDNYGIYKLGENKRENWELLDEAKEDDYFFHLSSFSSGYLILELINKDLELETIKKAALICKNGTKYRYINDIKIDYCLCGNVSKTENVGEVTFISNRKVKQVKL